jgi:hypothetical protein
MVPVATATDGGGSIRIPAAVCGLVGIKPTNGVVARRPIPSWIDLSTDGPLATSAADLRLLLDVEAGPAPGDPTALPSRRPEKGGLPRRVLAAPRFVPWGPIPAAVATAFDEALAGIEQDLGLPVEPVEPQALFRAGNPDLDWFVLAGAEHVSQLGRALLETNLDRLHPTTRAFMEAGMRVTVDEYVDARRRRFEYVRELDELLGDDLVIATPAVAAEGWSAEGVMPGASEPGLPAEVYNSAVQNVTGHPAISVPSGLLPNGLPFGCIHRPVPGRHAARPRRCLGARPPVAGLGARVRALLVLVRPHRPRPGGEQPEDLVGHVRGGHRGHLGVVVRRRDLDDVGGDDVHADQSPQDGQELAAGEPAGLGVGPARAPGRARRCRPRRTPACRRGALGCARPRRARRAPRGPSQ